MLSDEALSFFRTQARGKLPKAPLIAGADGGHWRAGDWSVAISADAANASSARPAQRIPARVSAYSFRHSRISELLQLCGESNDPLGSCRATIDSSASIWRTPGPYPVSMDLQRHAWRTSEPAVCQALRNPRSGWQAPVKSCPAPRGSNCPQAPTMRLND